MASRKTRWGALVAAVATAGALLLPWSTEPPSAAAGSQRYDVSSWTDPAGEHHVVRWDPCRPITYAVNPRLAGGSPAARSAALRDARGAMARAAAKSGMTFRFVGTTREVPKDQGGQGWAQRQRAADIVIAWVTPKTSNLLATAGSRYAAGTGGWTSKAWATASGRWRLAIGRGFAVINARQRAAFRPGFGRGTTRGGLLLHEIGHALGLNHVGSTRQLMYPTMLSRPSAHYEFGDRAGLSRVGRPAGCIGVTDAVWRSLPTR
jgi:hypothetical protein